MADTLAPALSGPARTHCADTGGVSDRELLERFISHNDGNAFADLVQRHGKLVWIVCRRVLRSVQDIEDAVQAVFLVLSRRAASIRKKEAVGSWLHGVAYRIAMKAKRRDLARAEKDKKVARVESEPAAWSEAAFVELQRLLDEEVQRLSKTYREPFVLCCLEGMSRSDAARELGCKQGTVASRLAHARAILTARLARRGVALSAALTAASLGMDATAAPVSLLQATAQAAFLPAGGEASVPEGASALANEYLHLLDLAQRRMFVGVLMLLAAFLTTAGLAAWQLGTQAPPSMEILDPDTFVPPPVAPGTAIDERVLAVAFAPDGKKLITGGGKSVGQVQIWDTANFKNLVTVRGTPGVRSIAYAPDRPVYAVGDNKGQIRICDGDTGRDLTSVLDHPGGVDCVAFSRDGKLLVSAGGDRFIRLWDGHDLKKLSALTHSDTVTSVAIFASGKAVVSGSRDRTAVIWYLDKPQVKWTTLPGHLAAVTGVAVSSDDKLVATTDGRVKLWDAATGKEAGVLYEGTVPASCAAFSSDGTLLAAGLVDGTIEICNVKSQKRVAHLEKHQAEVLCVAFSPDGQRLVSGSADKTFKIWTISSGDLAATINTEGKLPVALKVIPGQALSQEFYQDFRAPLDGSLTWVGRDGQEIIAKEDRGLRIKLTDKRTISDHVGLELHLPFKGDFEITARYEIVQADPPKTGSGVGVDVYIGLNSPLREAFAMCRVKQADGTERYRCSRMVDDERGRQYVPREFLTSTPVPPQSGQVRITRKENQLTYWAVKGEGDLRPLWTLPVGIDELQKVRLAAFPGHVIEPVELRLLDLRIRSESLGTGIPVARAFSDPQPKGLNVVPGGNLETDVAPGRTKSWLWALVIIVVLSLAMLFLVSRVARRRWNTEGDANEQTRLSLTCPQCGRSLRARAELAGKKVKCSKCGHVMLLPATTASPPASPTATQIRVSQ